MEKVVLFGAGSNLLFFIEIMEKMNFEICCLVDNDRVKQGQIYYGYTVSDPQIVLNNDYGVVVTSNSSAGIIKQLKKMGVSEERIIDYPRLLHWYAGRLGDGYGFQKKPQIHNSEQVIIDAHDGLGWGGMEVWSYHVGEALCERGWDVAVIGSLRQTKQKEAWEKMITRLPLDENEAWDDIPEIIESLYARMPFILICNWFNHVLAAAWILQQRFPQLVKIIGIAHNDKDMYYRRIQEWDDAIENIACVSVKISDELSKEYGIRAGKISVIGNFIRDTDCTEPNKRYADMPLQIGWASRIEKEQKRADLIVPFITGLGERGINYEMDIAGDGQYRKELETKLRNVIQAGKIRFAGQLSPDLMREFWKSKHIYLNFSEYEGASLTMLEAMANGTLAVVTDVSGVREYIKDGYSGLVCACGDITGFVSVIEALAGNEARRMKLAEAGMRYVQGKCAFKTYINNLESILQ